MKYLKKILLIICIALVFCFIVIETLLQLQYRYNTKKLDISKKTKGTFRIIALGNSYTQGVGAPPGEGFPGHLERLILNKYPKKKVEVINWGVGAANTSMILSKVQRDLFKMEPDLVIFRGGQANSFNRFNYKKYLNRAKIKKNILKNMFYKVHDKLFLMSRTYRFISYLYGQRLDMPSEKENFELDENESWSKQHNKISDKYNLINVMQLTDAQALKEIEWLKKEQKIRPHCITTYYMGIMYTRHSKDYFKAAKIFMKGIAEDPWPFHNYNYDGLIFMRQQIEDKSQKLVIDQFIHNWKKKYPELSYRLRVLTEEDTHKWAISDLTEIYHILKKRNIKAIMQNYPISFTNPDGRPLLNAAMRKLAADLKISFLDVEKVFEELKRKTSPGENFKKKYYSFDDHLNSLGYKINAKHLLKLIEDKNYLR